MKKRLVLDAGALISAEKSPRGKVYRICNTAMKDGLRALVPTVVLAQVWRPDARQTGVAALCNMCDSLPFEEEDAKEVGRLLRIAGSRDVVDAAVVAAAAMHSAMVVTSDPEDILMLAHAAGVPKTKVIPV